MCGKWVQTRVQGADTLSANWYNPRLRREDILYTQKNKIKEYPSWQVAINWNKGNSYNMDSMVLSYIFW